MNYVMVKCPICGSSEITTLSTIKDGENQFHLYKCMCCDSNFSSEILFKKSQESKNKIAINTLKKKTEEQEKEIEALQLLRKNELNGSEVFEKTKSLVVEIYIESNDYISSGTGILYKDNYVITNAHVLNIGDIKCEKNNVKCRFLKSTKQYNLEIIYIDKSIDFGVLKLINKPINEQIEANKIVKTGEQCFALGNAKGLGIAMFNGIIADNDRIVNLEHYLMFTAPVTTGNSGGPLFNCSGELIGMVTMGRTDTSSMNYAIPVSTIDSLFKKALDYEKVV